MFEEIRKEPLRPNRDEFESNSNDMSDFGNNNCDSNAIGEEGNVGINCGAECTSGTSSGIGDGGGCASEAGAGTSI